MATLISFLIVFAQESGPGEGSGDVASGLGLILGTLLVVVIVIAGIWTFAAKRGSRTPRREPHDRDRVGR